MMKRFTDIERASAINLFKQGFNYAQIGNKINRDRTAIRYLLRRNGYLIGRSQANKIYKVNENFLDNISLPEQAYFLGWIASDGYNNVERGEISIRLQESDGQILNVLSDILESNRPLQLIDYKKYKKHNTQNQLGLNVTSRKMSQKLASIGYGKNKSFTAIYPQNLEGSLHRHFIRGVFDGDGCFFTDFSGRGHLAQFYICGTKNLCSGIKKQFDNLNIKSKIIRDRKIYIVRVSGSNNILSILNWLYEDCGNLKLLRKYDKYKQFVSVKSRLTMNQKRSVTEKSLQIIKNI